MALGAAKCATTAAVVASAVIEAAKGTAGEATSVS